MKSIAKVSLIAISMGLFACGEKVQYDPKALGFDDKAEMEVAFAKGYHTKKKLTEMLPPPPKLEPTPALPIAPSALPSNPPQQVAEQSAQPTTNQEKPAEVALSKPTEAAGKGVAEAAGTAQGKSVEPNPSNQVESANKSVAAAATCPDVKGCVNAMLDAAKVENIAAAMEAARRIDGFEKPERGDRKLARKLNEEGLAAFKQGKNLEAINLLTKAREADKLDEEILSNLVHVYSEDGNHTKALNIALDGFVLNPRRTSLWIPYSEANAKLGKQAVALQSMWLAWQFSGNKEKLLVWLDKKISEESSAELKPFFVASRAWVIEGKKPQL